MKTRPSIPETDLANIAVLPTDAKRLALRRMKLSYPTHSYRPIRRSASDILNLQSGFLHPVARPPWSAVAAQIRKDCKTDLECTANLCVAEGLYSFAEAIGLSGRKHDIYPTVLGAAGKVVYWTQAVIAMGGEPVVPFFDPRRSTRLSPSGRRFAFSVMHERIRVADPDLAGVRLCIIQFANVPKGPRSPKMHLDAGIPLYSFEELSFMTQETYRIWHEVLDEREDGLRRRAAGERGSLL